MAESFFESLEAVVRILRYQPLDLWERRWRSRRGDYGESGCVLEVG